jgi:hypothetical protein
MVVTLAVASPVYVVAGDCFWVNVIVVAPLIFEAQPEDELTV